MLKYKNLKISQDIILYIKPLKTCLVKTEVCDMTLMSGALDKSLFDGNTFLLKKSEECGRHRYTYIGGAVVCSFLTGEDIYNYISSVGNILTPYSIAIGEENNYFLTSLFKFIKRDGIDDIELLSTNGNSVDPFDHHVSNYGKDSFKKLRRY